LLPLVSEEMSRRIPTFNAWMNSKMLYRKSILECTTEEAMLDFFYSGLSPWIQTIGYKWYTTENSVALHFLRFAYELHCALLQGPSIELYSPEPYHRNLPEDRDTFDFYTSGHFMDFLESWGFYESLYGHRLDHMILEFCYIWIDVTAGKPGSFTQVTLDMNDSPGSEDETDATLPDLSMNRRKYDLY